MWLEDELHSPFRKELLSYDLWKPLTQGRLEPGLPFSVTCIGIMGLGALLAYCGWESLP